MSSGVKDIPGLNSAGQGHDVSYNMYHGGYILNYYGCILRRRGKCVMTFRFTAKGYQYFDMLSSQKHAAR